MLACVLALSLFAPPSLRRPCPREFFQWGLTQGNPGRTYLHARPFALVRPHLANSQPSACALHAPRMHAGNLDLESDPWPSISKEAKGLVTKLLVRDPTK